MDMENTKQTCSIAMFDVDPRQNPTAGENDAKRYIFVISCDFFCFF